MDNTRRQAELPQLAIVPTPSLVLHEKHDAQRSAPLVARLRGEGTLKNPPIVAPIEGEGRYVVLDGTNRVEAIAALGYPHIVVQVVDYDDPALVVDTWFHLVSGVPCDDFFYALHTIDGLRIKPSDLLHARAEVARHAAMAYVIVPIPCGSVPPTPNVAHTQSDVHLLYADGDLHQQVAILNQMVTLYDGPGRIHRVNTDQLDQWLPYYENIAALVVFSRYQPSEIVELARRGACLPPGITRHVIPRRALRINFPLNILADDRPIEDKNAWLQEWLRSKLANKEIRYYQESIFLFDE
jgi:hypothetical protein